MAKRVTGPEIEKLIQLLAKVPGLGPRSARRAALHLIKKKEALLIPLGGAMQDAAEKVRICSCCGNVDTSDPCTICTDDRRDNDRTGPDHEGNARAHHELAEEVSSEAVSPEEVFGTRRREAPTRSVVERVGQPDERDEGDQYDEADEYDADPERRPLSAAEGVHAVTPIVLRRRGSTRRWAMSAANPTSNTMRVVTTSTP